MDAMQVLAKLSETLGNWPTVGLMLGLFSIPFLIVLAMFAQSFRIGPLAIEIRKTARDLDELSIAMAESRIAELEVAARQVISPLSDGDKQLLRQHVAALQAVVTKLRKT